MRTVALIFAVLVGVLFLSTTEAALRMDYLTAGNLNKLSDYLSSRGRMGSAKWSNMRGFSDFGPAPDGIEWNFNRI